MIEITNLHFHYQKGKPLIEKLTTTLESGQVYGLVGLNGVGKTTLLKLIAGLVFPKSGTVEVNKHSPRHRHIELLSDLYFLSDEVDLPNWKIKNIGSIYGPLYPNFDESYFHKILSDFDVDRQANIKDLSYGQRKKVNIAFALATNVNLILMDEPTNGLDIPSKAQFRKILAQQITEDKIIIISTHQIRDIHLLIDHLLVLQEQRFIVDASIYNLSKMLKTTGGKSDEALCTEGGLLGEQSIVPNTAQEDGPFDIELFFNALQSNDNTLNYISNLKDTSHATN